MKKSIAYVLCVFLAVAGSLASIYLNPSARAGTATANGLLSLSDITAVLRAGGFNLSVFNGHPSAAPELGGASPQVFSDNDHDIFYIYVFKSLGDRIEAGDSGGEDQFWTSLIAANLRTGFLPARNALIMYALPVSTTGLEQLKIENRRLESLRDIVFFRLNGGKVLVFQGEGIDWKAEVVYRYYEYWLPDPNGRLQYETWDNEHPWIVYQGDNLKILSPIRFECSFEAPAESIGATETTDKNGFGDLSDGFSGNGALIRATDTIDVTINWDGKKESFSLRCRSDGPAS